MKTTYRVQGLPEISRALGFVQPKAGQELLETLGFCDLRSASCPTRQEDETGNVAGENSLLPLDCRIPSREKSAMKKMSAVNKKMMFHH